MQGNQFQLPNLADTQTLIFIVIAVLLTALLLYLSTRLIAGKKETDLNYIIRLVLVSIVIFIVVFGIQAVIGSLGVLGQLSGLKPAIIVIIFVAIIYIVKLGVLPATHGSYDYWQRSIWISLITAILIFALNALTIEFFSTSIIPIL